MEIPLHLQSIRLALVEHAKDLIEAITAQQINPAVIVLDTLNRSMTGSEIRTQTWAPISPPLMRCERPSTASSSSCIATGCNASHSRGHTSLPHGVDVEIAVTHPVDLGTNATIKKMKDGESGGVISSRLEIVDLGRDEDDDPITSLVVLEDKTPAVAGDMKAKLSKNQKTMLGILHTAKRLSVSEWNEKAKEAGLGVTRRADLYDLREALKDKRLVSQFGDACSINHSADKPHESE